MYNLGKLHAKHYQGSCKLNVGCPSTASVRQAGVYLNTNEVSLTLARPDHFHQLSIVQSRAEGYGKVSPILLVDKTLRSLEAS